MSDTDKKLRIINLISKTENSELINAVYESVTQYETDVDFWDSLTEKEQEAIEKGLDDVKQGRVTSHEVVKEKYGL